MKKIKVVGNIPQGRWIVYDDGYRKCPNCKNGFAIEVSSSSEFKYCPFCGKRLK